MSKFLPRNYEEIEPTILEPSESHRYIEEILDFADNSNEGVSEVVAALEEMAKRLSDQYKIFNKNESKRILSYIQKTWKDANVDQKEGMGSLLYGLEDRSLAISFLEGELNIEDRDEVLSIINDVLSELRE